MLSWMQFRSDFPPSNFTSANVDDCCSRWQGSCYLYVQVFVNESRTRTFLVACLCKGDRSSKEVGILFPKVDKVLAYHHMRPFFSNPQPHVSIMWWAGDHQAAVEHNLPQLQQLWTRTVGPLACTVRCCSRLHAYSRDFGRCTSCEQVDRGSTASLRAAAMPGHFPMHERAASIAVLLTISPVHTSCIVLTMTSCFDYYGTRDEIAALYRQQMLC